MKRAGNDLTIYCEHASEWWNSDSPAFRTLHAVNEHRLSLIEEWYPSLSSWRVADLGCGGGLVALPLAERGARVVGIDISAESIAEAQMQSQAKGQVKTTFAVGDIRSTSLPSQSFDLVLLADVVEHIEEYPKVISEAARLLKPNGQLFVSTLNRTWRSWLLALKMSEGLRLVPPGTHAYEMLVTPKELTQYARACGFICERVQGSRPKILTTLRTWAIHLKSSNDASVAYTASFRLQDLRMA